MVVLGHALLGYVYNNAFGVYDDFFLRLKDWIYIWHMPLFMCLSGYSFCVAYYRENELNTVKVEKQIVNLVLQYFVFSVLLYGLKMPLSMFTDDKVSFVGALINIVFPNTIMWYLWVLAIYYTILLHNKPLMKMIATKPRCILVVLLAVAVVYRISENFIDWRLCFGNMFRCALYFCFGLVLCINKNVKEWSGASRTSRWQWGGILILIVHFFCFMTQGAGFASGGLVSLVYSVIDEFAAVLIVAVTFAVASRCHRTSRLLSALGRASLVIYLLHTYMVTAMKVVAIRIGLCSNLWMDILVLAISTVIPISICYFIDWIRRRSRLVGAIFAPGKHLKIG